MANTYDKNVSAFKKWLPIKTWLGKQSGPANGPASIAVACDQVNRAVNSGFVYQRDGLSDVWYTPEQFVKFKGGDCEDFSIYKMHKLIQLGVKPSQMEMVICIDKKSRAVPCGAAGVQRELPVHSRQPDCHGHEQGFL